MNLIKIIKNFFLYNKWLRIAQDIRGGYPTYDCKGKVLLLTDEMNKAGMYGKYDIKHGYYMEKDDFWIPHRWVELNGQIIDPSVYDDNKSRYKEKM